MSFYNWVHDKFFMFSWTGPKKAPYGELLRPITLPPMDYSSDREKTITTTIDCFVTGQYVDNRGKLFTIRERYKISVSYSNSTIIETMMRVRQMLIMKFTEENPSFSVSEVFVPDLYPDMTSRRLMQPIFSYKGGKIWKYLTRIEEGKLVLGIEKDIYKSRAEAIIAKYSLKRSQGLIRRL